MAGKDEDTGKIDKKWFGILLAALSPFLFQFGNMGLKYTYTRQSDIPLVLGSILLQNVVYFVITSSSLLVDRVNPFAVEVKTFVWLVAAAFMENSGCLSCYVALSYIDLGTETTILSTIPFFAMAFGYIFLKEKMKLFEVFLAVVSATGIALVVKTTKESTRQNGAFGFILGVCLALFACLLISIYLVLARRNANEIDFRIQIFYASILGMFIISITLFISKQSNNLTLLSDGYLYTLLSAGVVVFLAFSSEVLALRYERVGVIGLFKNTEILYAWTFDVVVQRVPLTTFGVLGVLMVLCASVLIGLNELYNIDKIIAKKLKK